MGDGRTVVEYAPKRVTQLLNRIQGGSTVDLVDQRWLCAEVRSAWEERDAALEDAEILARRVAELEAELRAAKGG